MSQGLEALVTGKVKGRVSRKLRPDTIVSEQMDRLQLDFYDVKDEQPDLRGEY